MGEDGSALSSTEFFNLSSNQWITLDSMVRSRTMHGMLIAKCKVPYSSRHRFYEHCTLLQEWQSSTTSPRSSAVSTTRPSSSPLSSLTTSPPLRTPPPSPGCTAGDSPPPSSGFPGKERKRNRLVASECHFFEN